MSFTGGRNKSSRFRFRFPRSPLAVFLLFSLAILAPLHSGAENTASNVDYSNLRQRLLDDGISAETVNRYFADPRFRTIPELLKVNVRQPNAKPAYEGFVSSESVALTAEYLERHRATFDSALADSPVDPETVAAILRVESSLGAYKGKYRLMNVFATLTLLDSDQLETAAPTFWDRILDGATPDEESSLRERASKRARSKAKWAYRELKTLLAMSETGTLDPLSVKGSWAGAFGLPQFLPSSMSAYAVDGDGDGTIDLDSLPDAVASIANYLAVHGYRFDNPEKRRKAIWRYNHSDEYVDCIIILADRVREQTP